MCTLDNHAFTQNKARQLLNDLLLKPWQTSKGFNAGLDHTDFKHLLLTNFRCNVFSGLQNWEWGKETSNIFNTHFNIEARKDFKLLYVCWKT